VKAEEMGGETEGDFMDNSIVCKYILQSLWKPSKPCEEERKVVGEGHTGE